MGGAARQGQAQGLQPADRAAPRRPTAALQRPLQAPGAFPDADQLEADAGLADDLNQPSAAILGSLAGGVITQPAAQIQRPLLDLP
jgi:hypothetical protein